MKNVHSSDGIAEDVIRTIVQLVCGEGHIKTLIEKTTAELENGLIDVEDRDALEAASRRIDDLGEELNELSRLRRNAMLWLYEQYDGDKTYWCQVKHLASAMYTAFESWQASDDDPMLYGLYMDTNKQFIRALTHFLGVEVTTCAACFADALKGENDAERDDGQY